MPLKMNKLSDPHPHPTVQRILREIKLSVKKKILEGMAAI